MVVAAALVHRADAGASEVVCSTNLGIFSLTLHCRNLRSASLLVFTSPSIEIHLTQSEAQRDCILLHAIVSARTRT